ncbi:serine hydrolase [Knoellia sp. CPCC 206450]|uniref:serine hydrolase n=1 Tax=Knoellia tibetensis TaxID=3404798 RepID=UPI003B42C2CF
MSAPRPLSRQLGRPINRRLVLESALAGAAVGVPAWLAFGTTANAGVESGIRGRGAVAPAAAAPGVVPSLDRSALTAALDAHLAERGGTMGLVVHDLRTGGRFAWREFENESLSTIKVLILLACLKKVQDGGEPLTNERHSQARRMIQASDNAATDALLEWVTTAKVQEAAGLLGLEATTVRGGGPAGSKTWWGYSRTTPGDLVSVVDAVVTGTPVIHAGHRAYIRHLMAGVVPDQRWGVADPPLPRTAYTETKNGWGPLPDGYRLNSIGRVLGNGRSHTMAILTRSPQGFRYGRETINGLSKIVYDALAQPLPAE